MGRGTFLVNPLLTPADVTMVASSELGRRAANIIPFDGNSGLLTVTTFGDAGDGLDRDVEILGTQRVPLYNPKATDGSSQWTDPETAAALGSLSGAGADAKAAFVAVRDQLHMVVTSGTSLAVYRWNGSAWTIKAGATIVDSDGGLAACVIGENIYIAIASSASAAVDFWRFNAVANALGLTAEQAVASADTILSLALASNGSSFVLLVATDANDVEVWTGGTLDALELQDDTIGAAFTGVSGWAAEISAPAIAWNEEYSYVAAFRVGTSSPAALRLGVSVTGDDWREFEDLRGQGFPSQPTTTTPWGDAACCALSLENRRVFIYRATAATQDNPPTDIKMQWFDGRRTWSAEVDVDGSVAISTGAQVAAAMWRGAMFFGWRSDSTTITVRKNNELTGTDTGYYRELRLGEPNYVAGPEDDTRTALFFVATGSVTAGDAFQIPAGQYDYPIEHILSQFMSQVWRGDENAAQVLRFDAGDGRAFAVDAIAIVGANLPNITIEIAEDDAFTSPVVSQVLSAALKTAAVTGADRNRVTFASGSFAAHAFAPGNGPRWVQFSSGTSEIFRVLDNTDDALMVDGDATGATGTATIFGDALGYFFDQVYVGRYLRFVTPTLVLPDGFYKIAFAVWGLKLELPRNFSNGFERESRPVESLLRLRSGARHVTRLNQKQAAAFTLPWQVVELDKHLTAIRGLYGVAEGGSQLVAFWPFPVPLGAPAATGDQAGVYVGRFESPQISQINKTFYSVSGMRFEEEV